jgi:dCMP deaminase
MAHPLLIELQRKWDLRFLRLAREVATWSKDPSTQVGAVIVRRNRSVHSVGFNGFPQGMSDDPALYADRDSKYSRTVHAEMNALIFAYGSVEDCTLYTWPFAPCDRCAAHMVQAHIRRFVFPSLPADKVVRWAAPLALAVSYFKECGAEFEEISEAF